MTTKLEELKALMDSATKGPWEETYGAQRDEVCSFVVRGAKGNEPTHHFIHGQNGKNGATNSDADAALIVAMHNLLPHLIAVAEVAQKVCWYDFSTSELDGDVILDMRHLQTALEPLTKGIK